MQIRTAYNTWAETYDTDPNKTRDLDMLITRQMLKNLRCDTLLEIGCGTGKNSRFYATLGQSVQAVDFSQAMVAKAKEKVNAPNVTFSAADLTQPWLYDKQTFDFVACNLVLEHIENLDHIFTETARVLRPKGQFFISELHPFRQYQGTKANFQRSEGKIEIPAFVHHLSEFVDTAVAHNLTLQSLKEWWHEADVGKPPRLVSFLFGK